MSSQPPPEAIVIVGGGIIGIASAYYLLTSPHLPPRSTVTLVENSRHGVASGASRHAGGFLAGGTGSAWQAPASRPLARLSWKCHVALAAALRGEQQWGFRECSAVGLSVGAGAEERSVYRLLPEDGKVQVVEKDWLVGDREDLTGDGGVGQIDPAAFCQVLYAQCLQLGLTACFGAPLALSPRTSSRRQLQLQLHASTAPSTIEFTKLLIAAGPWSASLCATLALPPIPITNLPGHSLLIRPSSPSPLPAEAVFAGISGSAVGVHASTSGAARSLSSAELSAGYTPSPELFPRSSGVVYVAGENAIPSVGTPGRLPHKLPETVDGVEGLLDAKLVQRLLVAARAVSPFLDAVGGGAVVEKAQVCYRPITPDGEPIIDELEPGILVASGHGPWGITLAPGTGKVVSEMMLNQRLSADITGLRLSRF